MADIQVITSPQTIKKGIFQSMFDAYGVLVSNPFAFVLFLVGLLCIVSELNNSFGPLEIISNALLDYCEHSTGPLVPLAKFLLQLINWIIPIKINFFLCLFFIIPAIINSSMSYWITSLIFCFVCIFTNLGTLELFLFSQFYFMYCFVDDNWYKFVILFLSFVSLIIGLSSFTSMIGLA